MLYYVGMKLKQALERLEDLCAVADDAMSAVEVAETHVGMALRAEREAKKISLRSFATKVGISPAYLSDIELGNRYPAFDTLERIKKALKV